jgi:hypothetical protein
MKPRISARGVARRVPWLPIIINSFLCSACGSPQTVGQSNVSYDAIIARQVGVGRSLTAVDEINVDTLLNDFVNGRIVLANRLSSIWLWTQNERTARVLYETEDWQKLSKLMIQINYGVDLNWFFLGRSAEGLGLTNAALQYYTEALLTWNKCDGVSNLCVGFALPRDILTRLSVLGVHCTVLRRPSHVEYHCPGLPPSLATPTEAVSAASDPASQAPSAAKAQQEEEARPAAIADAQIRDALRGACRQFG